MVKLLSCVVSTYLYGAFDCMFLSCHARVSERNHTQYVPQCQGVPILLREPKAQTLGTMGYKQNAHEKDILQLSFR